MIERERLWVYTAREKKNKQKEPRPKTRVHPSAGVWRRREREAYFDIHRRKKSSRGPRHKFLSLYCTDKKRFILELSSHACFFATRRESTLSGFRIQDPKTSALRAVTFIIHLTLTHGPYLYSVSVEFDRHSP